MKTAVDLLKEKDASLVTVSPDTTIFDALQVMLDKQIGSMLIEEQGEIVGIWTERDLMKNATEDNFDIKSAAIKDHMSKGLVKAPHNCSIYKMMDTFLGRRVRRLLIEEEGKVVGLLSMGDVVKANLVEKQQELEELNKIVSFEYYSNWKWKKKK